MEPLALTARLLVRQSHARRLHARYRVTVRELDIKWGYTSNAYRDKR